jgi:hypothetical protein
MTDEQIIEAMLHASTHASMRAAFAVCAAAIREQDAKIAEELLEPENSYDVKLAAGIISRAIRAQEPSK